MQLYEIIKGRVVFGSKRSLVRIQSPRPSKHPEITEENRNEPALKRYAINAVFSRFLPLFTVSICGKFVGYAVSFGGSL